MNKKLFTKKSVIKSVFGVLYVFALLGIIVLLNHFHGVRTFKTSKWDISIEGEKKYTCLTYTEMEIIAAKLDKQKPLQEYELHALAGIGSWICEQGWRN